MRLTKNAALILAGSLLAASALAVGATSPGPAKLWTVHIDEVEAGKIETFEKLVAEQSSARAAILHGHGLPVPPAFEISTTRSSYYVFRPRGSYSELDGPSKLPDEVRRLLREKVESLDDAIHASLRTHSSQIWSLDEESSYVPSQPRAEARLPAFLHLHSEWVKPGESASYGEVLAKMHEALVKTKSTLRLLVFSSPYGDGAVRFLWMADLRAEFLQGSDLGRLFAAAYGKTEAERLLARWRGCVFRSDDTDAAPRPDLNAGDPAWGWMGLR